MEFRSDNFWPYGNLQTEIQQSELLVNGNILGDFTSGGLIQELCKIGSPLCAEHQDSLPGAHAIAERYNENGPKALDAYIGGARRMMQRVLTSKDEKDRMVHCVLAASLHRCYNIMSACRKADATHRENWQEPAEVILSQYEVTDAIVYRILCQAALDAHNLLDDMSTWPLFAEQRNDTMFRKFANDCNVQPAIDDIATYVQAQAKTPQPREVVYKAAPVFSCGINKDSVRTLMADIEDRNGFIVDVRSILFETVDEIANLTKGIKHGSLRRGELTTVEIQIQHMSVLSSFKDLMDIVRGEIPVRYELDDRLTGVPIDYLATVYMREAGRKRPFTKDEIKKMYKDDEKISKTERFFGTKAAIMVAMDQCDMPTAVKQRSRRLPDSKDKKKKDRKAAQKAKKKNRK